jgi:hypothetical protein
MIFLTNHDIKITFESKSEQQFYLLRTPFFKWKYPADTRFTETESISRISGLPGIKFRKYLTNPNSLSIKMKPVFPGNNPVSCC